LWSIPKIKNFKWNIKYPTIEGIRVSYFNQFLLRLKRRHIREKTKELSQQKYLEKEAKKNWIKFKIKSKRI